MTDIQLIEYLVTEGYYEIRYIPGRGVCGLSKFAFTTGLVYGMCSAGYQGRYCYENSADASKALAEWDGVNDPSDEEWIKHKGRTEYSNPKRQLHEQEQMEQ